MTNKELKKYFDKRPSVNTLYVVDGAVFIDELTAANYADELGLVMETHNRGDEDATEPEATETGETETGETNVEVSEETETEETETEATVSAEPVTAEPVTAEPVTTKPVTAKRTRNTGK